MSTARKTANYTPGLIAEREQRFMERQKAAMAVANRVAQGRICNSIMPSDEPYRTGDGEVPTVVRPGAMRAYSLPSRGIGA